MNTRAQRQDRNERSSEEVGEDVLSSGAIHVTSSLVKVLGFLLTEGMENVEHYKMVVLRERAPWQPAAATRGRGRRSSGGSRGGMSGGGYGVGGAVGAMEAYLCFWCQSAGVCFSEIDKQVHSVILTSGEKAISSESGRFVCLVSEGVWMYCAVCDMLVARMILV